MHFRLLHKEGEASEEVVGDRPWQMEKERRRDLVFPWGGGGGGRCQPLEVSEEGERPETGVALHLYVGREGMEPKGPLQSGPNFTPEEINPRKFVSRNRPFGQWEHHQSVINASLNSCPAGLRKAR